MIAGSNWYELLSAFNVDEAYCKTTLATFPVMLPTQNHKGDSEEISPLLGQSVSCAPFWQFAEHRSIDQFLQPVADDRTRNAGFLYELFEVVPTKKGLLQDKQHRHIADHF
jgi:hypothetical protein